MDFMTYYKQLKNNEIAALNLITGNEQYLIDNIVKMIEKSFLIDAYKDLNFTTIEGQFDVDQFLSISETLPFFDEKRIVFVNNVGLFKNVKEEAESKLLAFLKSIPEQTVLLFVEKDLDKRKKLYKFMTKAGTCVSIDKMTHSEFFKWVSKKFKSYDKPISNHALNYFIEMSNYLDKESNKNLYDVDNTIKSLVNNESEITEQIINQYLEIPIEHNIFKMIDAISEKKIQTSLLILNELVGNGEPEIKIFYLINQQFRNILKTKYLIKNGYSSNIVATKLGIHPFVAKKAAHFANQYSFEALHKIVDIVETVDIEMKSTGLSPHLLIEKALFQIHTIE
ncbi:DNA polymerase III subunit delta [Fusibacter ferrireducens]|uniref:DNA polymerase III subunit delta n=1 Tax=Fusibacter ferrireducens TaxID=2785058 RepID=A0ABR9ZWQ5_9FIRM|nr:DNA polymerase III subunit delta [Fusibacter ferrireducens]MBF4694903.1 DNA polymerase III subunit delta [Fusibacter ferrireducens]